MYQDAINDYTRTLEKSPWNVNAYRNRGFAKAKLGRREAAEVDFQKAKELDPNVGK
ncbi:tetratricopeptide repeat protein [Candidatus Poribacteria bacterium]|nr:tetratricopeptide repeat protein [Candidatus Poribacteria bacterium]